MKKSKKYYVIFILLAVIVVGLYFAPVITLMKMRHDVSANGIGALQPYISEELRTPFDILLTASHGVAFAGNAVKMLAGKPSVNAVFSLLQDKSANIKWSLSSFMRGLNTANASFKISNKDFSGTITLLIKREKGKWVIYDMAIPLLGWSLG